MSENMEGAIKQMDNPEKLATLSTQDTGRRQTKKTHTTMQDTKRVIRSQKSKDRQNNGQKIKKANRKIMIYKKRNMLYQT
jgi:hypothetical protein